MWRAELGVKVKWQNIVPNIFYIYKFMLNCFPIAHASLSGCRCLIGVMTFDFVSIIDLNKMADDIVSVSALVFNTGGHW